MLRNNANDVVGKARIAILNFDSLKTVAVFSEEADPKLVSNEICAIDLEKGDFVGLLDDIVNGRIFELAGIAEYQLSQVWCNGKNLTEVVCIKFCMLSAN